MTRGGTRLGWTTLAIGVLLIGILAGTAFLFRATLQQDIHQKIIERDAAVLDLVAEAQLREAEADPDNRALMSEMLLTAVLKTVRGMRAVIVYDNEGNVLQTSTPTLVQSDLNPDDYARLVGGEHISRYNPAFPFARYFSDQKEPGPMLEVLLPVHAGGSGQTVGLVKYLIDGHSLGRELAAIDRGIDRQTLEIFVLGSALIVLVLTGAYFGLRRAQQIIAERNERLTRANFELTLAAKTSALGIITSHLIHGLQGPVAGLRAVVADRISDDSDGTWRSAVDYTDRMQSMIHETVALLGDSGARTTFDLTGSELAEIIRTRNQAAALAKGVLLEVASSFEREIDSHRGSLACLIATNLVQNAIDATPPGRHVRVKVAPQAGGFALEVADEGEGIPEEIRPRLFEPGRTGKPGGTGLGLAISQLLARQIRAELTLIDTGTAGTRFRLLVPGD
jgi:signal transduction histidine kinase